MVATSSKSSVRPRPSLAALEQPIAEALAAITPENTSAWFAHCNYGLR